ncbi:MAG: O-antigen ligase family protein [Planctomycetaceae bacterium]|nr:O-antigen ligase family protein [Planctomycetaceae bacterium]
MSRAPTSSMTAAVVAMICVVALNLRWFIPAEDSADGATSWLAAFWCLAAVIATSFRWVNDAVSRRWTRADAAVALLVGGHLLGGMLVLMNGGNRHTAAILIVEWLGIAAVWSILRDLVRVPGIRAAIWQSTLLAIIAVAVSGCWQHWIELPSMAQRLGPKFDAVRAGSDVARQELSREGVPLNEPDFTLFEKRLRDSREPFAFFALANTLGGFLATGLMMLLADRLCATGSASVFADRENVARSKEKTLAEPVAHEEASKPQDWSGLTILGVIAIGLCLLLTKSRTALLAALLVGGTVVGFRVLGTRFKMLCSRRIVTIVVGGLIAATVLIGLLSRLGSWDREMLTEAAKSLSYRVYYWTGTAELIAEHPILGGGLGQFRNAYLRVKAPAASEEIADPHNLLLDVWFQGGLLAAAGAFWLAATLLVTVWKTSRPDSRATECRRPAEPRLLLCGAVSPLVVFVIQYIASEAWDDRLVVAGLALIVAAYLISKGHLSLPVPSRRACGLGAIVLFTHLLGAGGIGYTAVMQFLLLCLAGTFSAAVVEDQPAPLKITAVWIRRGFFIVATVCVLLLWRPDLREMVESADQLMTKGAPDEVIRKTYTRAMQADRWDPIPCARLAEFEFRQWQDDPIRVTGNTSELPQNLQAAVNAIAEASQRDPQNGHWWYRRGTMLQTVADRVNSPTIAKQAVTSLDHAVRLYPTNSQWQADLSDAAIVAGTVSLAEKAARNALTQDDVNQRFGHLERILAAEIRARLERRTAVSPPN